MGKITVKSLLGMALLAPLAVATPVYVNFNSESAFSALASVSSPQSWSAPYDVGLRNTSVTIGVQHVNVQLLYWTPMGTPNLSQYPADPTPGSSTTRPASGFRQTFEAAPNAVGGNGQYWFFNAGTNILVPMESSTPAAGQPTYLIWRFTFSNSADYATSIRGFGVEMSTPSVNAVGEGFGAVMNAYANGATVQSFTNNNMIGGPSSCAVTGLCTLQQEVDYYNGLDLGSRALGFMGIWNSDALRTIDHIDIISLAPVNGQAALGRFYIDFSGSLPPWQPPAVPEPATVGGTIAGLGAILYLRARKRS